MGASFPAFFVLFLTVASVVAFTRDRIPLEVSSLALVVVLLLFGQVFPFMSGDVQASFSPDILLAGFANPSLIAVMALLVMGQALMHTDALRLITGVFGYVEARHMRYAIYSILAFIFLASAFVNNTPLVVIAIPLIQALAASYGMSDSRVMIPLSYVAILGGMTTLVGSSTNLLVSSSLEELGYAPLEFFGFFVPGMILACAGLVYAVFILPLFMKDRSTMASALRGEDKEFIAELDVTEGSKLVGASFKDGVCAPLKDLKVRMVQRQGGLLLPPFENISLESGDVLIAAATRENLTKILSSYPGTFLSEEESRLISQSIDSSLPEERILAELMITPASRFMDMSLERAGFDHNFGLVVLGIQRRARVMRRRLGDVRLEAGDVLLVAARRRSIDNLRENKDFIFLSGSKRSMPEPKKALIAGSIFIGTIVCAAMGVLSIPVAAISGAGLMIATRCLNIRQAVRAMDRKIFFLVGATLALGSAMQSTGAAIMVSEGFLGLPFLNTPFMVLSGFFLLVAVCTNLLSNNACAILFTPIAMSLGEAMAGPLASEYSLSYVFAITVVFAANCSFASPIGYQTNLLVMGPGHYRFSDFARAGVPLLILMWLVYMLLLKFYFGV